MYSCSCTRCCSALLDEVDADSQIADVASKAKGVQEAETAATESPKIAAHKPASITSDTTAATELGKERKRSSNRRMAERKRAMKQKKQDGASLFTILAVTCSEQRRRLTEA